MSLAPEKPGVGEFGAPFTDAGQVRDPETDVSATQYNKLIAQVTMISKTVPIAWVSIDSLGVIQDHSAVWGSTGAVAPTVTVIGPTEFDVEWAASYDDLQVPTPESHAVNIRAASLTMTAGTGNAVIAAANTVTVTMSGAADFFLVIW